MAHLNDISHDFNTADVLNYVNVCVFEDFEQNWHRQLWNDNRQRGGNKLRTYRQVKTEFSTEHYLTMHMTLSQRRAFASIRCGVAPLRIETGRYS